MSLKLSIDIDDPILESGIAAGRAAYNAASGLALDDVGYAEVQAREGLEHLRGTGNRILAEKIAQIEDPAAIAEVATLVDAKIAEKPQPIVEPAPMEPPIAVPVGP